MGTPADVDGYRLTTDGSAFVVDYALAKTATYDFTFYDPATDVAKSIAGGVVNYSVRDDPGGTELKGGTMVLQGGGTGGVARLTLATSDFATGIVWDLGEAMKEFSLFVNVVISSVTHRVWDDAGNYAFPFRLHWSP